VRRAAAGAVVVSVILFPWFAAGLRVAGLIDLGWVWVAAPILALAGFAAVIILSRLVVEAMLCVASKWRAD
jgi:hypothetical protein